MQHAGVGPALQLLHRVDAVHPRLRIGDHDPGRQELAELRPRQHPLLHQHLDARGRRQVAVLVVRALRQDQVHLLERVQHREAVGDHRRVVVLLVEAAAEMLSRLWNASRNFERLSAVRTSGHRAACEPQAVLVVVLVVAAHDRQPVLLVLDVAPEQVVQRPQRIDLEVRQRIVAPVPRGFWNRRAIAFIVCTSIPSSCQYDQISSSRQGWVSLSRRMPKQFSGSSSSMRGEHRALERHVPHLVADQGEVGQGGVWRSVHGLQVLVPQAAQMTCVPTRRTTRSRSRRSKWKFRSATPQFTITKASVATFRRR